MCSICQSFLCLDACPNYEGEDAEYGRPVGRCAVCRTYIYQGDRYSVTRRGLVCKKCREEEEQDICF